jgi:hypothetical protein
MLDSFRGAITASPGSTFRGHEVGEPAVVVTDDHEMTGAVGALIWR